MLSLVFFSSSCLHILSSNETKMANKCVVILHLYFAFCSSIESDLSLENLSLEDQISLIRHVILCDRFFHSFFFFFFLNILFPYIDRSDRLLFLLCHKFRVRTTRYTSCGKQLFHIDDLHLFIFFQKIVFDYFPAFICT